MPCCKFLDNSVVIISTSLYQYCTLSVSMINSIMFLHPRAHELGAGDGILRHSSETVGRFLDFLLHLALGLLLVGKSRTFVSLSVNLWYYIPTKRYYTQLKGTTPN